MKICGIIVELNPAHNGHKYIFDRAKEITDADRIIAVISGDYVQRGEPAIINKQYRTKMALALGADAVIELPTIFATGSAQYFARGAVAILDNLGCDCIVFGSETGDIEYLRNNEITTSNDILAKEYLLAIEYFGSSIKPYAVKRIGASYNDTVLSDINYSSASALRELLNNSSEDTYNLANNMPKEVLDILISYQEDLPLIFYEDFNNAILYSLSNNYNSGYSIFFDVYQDFADKIYKHFKEYTNAEEFCHILKSKDIAFSHIKRGLLHILLSITNEHINIAKNNNYYLYSRLLGFKESKSDLLSEIKKRARKPIISKLSDAPNVLDENIMKILNNDIKASELYSYICNSKKNAPHIDDEFKQKIVILP